MSHQSINGRSSIQKEEATPSSISFGKNYNPWSSVFFDKHSNTWTWHQLRIFAFPMEIFFIIFMFIIITFTQLYQQYFFQRITRDALSKLSNYTTPSHSVCLKQDYIVNYTGNASFQNLQANVNSLSMYGDIICSCTSSLMALILGPLSDRIGRKPIICYNITGVLLAGVIQILVIELNLNVHYYLLAIFIYSLGGGYTTMSGIAFASITDITPKKWLTVRMGAIEAGIGIGKALSFIVTYIWLQHSGCDFGPPSWLMLGALLLLLIYFIFLPESLPKNRRYNGFTKIVNGAKIYFWPKYVGFSCWWKVWVATIIICVECLCDLGTSSITPYFLHNKPLQWSYDYIGIYGVVISTTSVGSLLIILPILVAIGLSNALIALISAGVAIATNIVIANIRSTWEMYIAGGIKNFDQVGFAAIRSILTGLVSPNDYGAILTITSALQSLASVGASILFNKTYHPQSIVNGHTVNAGIVFWISAGIWIAIVPFILLFLCFKPNKPPRQQEDEPLLSSSDAHNYDRSTINREYK